MVKDYIENLNKPIGKEYSKKLEVDYQKIGNNELNNIVIITEEFLRKNIGLLKKENTEVIMKELKKIARTNKFKKID